MILTLQGHETKSQILFLIKASSSDYVKNFQLGSNKARVEFLGRGDIIK